MINVYFESIKRLYNAGKINAAGVATAVGLEWITETQYQEITGFVYPATS